MYILGINAYHAILFRKGFGYCEDKLYDQHFVLEGQCGTIKSDMIDILTDSLSSFTERHNKWATLEAKDQISAYSKKNKGELVQAKFTGNAQQRRSFLNKFTKSFLYF